MSLLPEPAGGGGVRRPDHPGLQERPYSPAERRARWEVRAAQWRAREIAEIVFGSVGRSSLVSLRPQGPLRGLMELEVPFDGLDAHREREERFMAAVGTDPVLSRIPLVFVVAPSLV